MGFTITQQLPARHGFGWTVKEFEDLFDAGYFGRDLKLELIEGEIWRKVPLEPPCATSIILMQTQLMGIFREDFTVRVQLPLIFGVSSKPEPDLAVVEGSPRESSRPHPTSAILVVEISDSTLVPDQQTKAPLYARAGVAEYWIVNLIENVLEVRREPTEIADSPLGFGYASTQILRSGDSISPLAMPDSTVRVEDLLP